MAFPDNWAYRNSISLNGSSDGALSNFPVWLTISFITGKMRSDFGDVRFTKSDGTTEIPYHLVSYTESDEAVFVLKLDSIPASPDTVSIYMYYGNLSETTTSDPANVYDVYISGDTDESSKFTLVDIYNSGVNASLTYDSGNKYYKLKTTSVEDEVFAKIDDLDSTANLILRASIYRATAMSNQQGGLVGRKKASDTLILGRYITQSVNRLDITQRLSGSYSVIDSDSYTLQQLTWFTVELIIVGTTATLNWYNSSGTLINSETGTISGSIDSGDWGLFSAYSISAENYFKNITALKTTPNPPTWGEWGSEEELVYSEDLKTLIHVPTRIGWLSGWEAGWRQEIVYAGSTDGVKTSEILEIQIPYSSGFMREDRGDIRFTLQDGLTLLDYTLVDVSAEAPDYTATFHVRVPTIPAYPDEIVLYAYCGNSEATDASDPDETYNFHDNFEDGSVDTTKWPYTHGVDEDGGELILDYHTDSEAGSEDYAVSGVEIEPNTKTVMSIQPQTLDGPFRFGLYYPSDTPTYSRVTFMIGNRPYIGIILANEYIQTNCMSSYGNYHDTIQQFDVTDHIFEIIWKEDYADIYYDGELIKSYNSEYLTHAMNILFRDRGFVNYVYSHNYSVNPPTLVSQGDWEKPSAYLDTYIDVPHRANLNTLIEVSPVNASLKSLITARQEAPADLKTLIKSLPTNVSLKTLIEVAGLYNADLKTLIEVASPYLYNQNADLDVLINVVNEFIHSSSDLTTRILVGKQYSTSLLVDWNVTRGDIDDVEGGNTPFLIVEIDGQNYS